jgi:hypothetical protein
MLRTKFFLPPAEGLSGELLLDAALLMAKRGGRCPARELGSTSYLIAAG